MVTNNLLPLGSRDAGRGQILLLPSLDEHAQELRKHLQMATQSQLLTTGAAREKRIRVVRLRPPRHIATFSLSGVPTEIREGAGASHLSSDNGDPPLIARDMDFFHVSRARVRARASYT